jgi:hypothetical protein
VLGIGSLREQGYALAHTESLDLRANGVYRAPAFMAR